jgi:DMSO/TMAO reductase YedYZ molybdopterin-dependent catalytic subunit
VSDEAPEKTRKDPDEAGGAQRGGPEPGSGGDGRLRYSRRWFLVMLGGAAAGFAGLVELSRRLGGPATRRSGGPQSLSEDFPVRTVEDASEVSKPLRQWVIEVDGLVEKPLHVDYAVWSTLPRLEQTVDFHCVEGWSVGGVRWAGVRPAELLSLARPRPQATHVIFHAAGGTYVDTLTMKQLNEATTVLADTLDGELLPPEHGGPIRLVVPTQLGYKSVKFVRRLEVVDHGERGYWEQYGYPVDAPVKSGSGR